MAEAFIVQRYSDGSATKLYLGSDLNHPDVYDELVTRVLHMHREVCIEVDDEAEQ